MRPSKEPEEATNAPVEVDNVPGTEPDVVSVDILAAHHGTDYCNSGK